MANRYWVGGSGTWNTISTTHWSATSGGASGASAPTTADSVFFDQAGSYSVTNSSSVCLNFTVSAGSPSFSASIGIYGSFSISSTPAFAVGGIITFASTTTGKTITTNGISIGSDIYFDGVGGGWTLQDALTCGQIGLYNGALSLNDKTLTGSTLTCGGTGVCSINFGTIGTIVLKNAAYDWNSSNANLTVLGTPIVSFTYSGASTSNINVGTPTESNSISFNFTAGTYGVFITGGVVKNLNFTGYSGNWTIGGTIYGNLILSSTMTTSFSSTVTFAATSGTKTISTNAVLINTNITFNGVGGTWQLQDAITIGTTRIGTLTNGTIDLNGKTLTVGTRFLTAAGTKNITFNGGTLVCPAANTTSFNNAAPTNFTTTTGTGTGKISMTAATAKTFVGGGSTFNCTLSNDGAGALTVTGANTFTTIANGVQPTSFLFTAGTTTTLTNWNVSGTAGNLVTIGSVTAATHTLSKASGTILSEYVSVTNSIATGGATWYAAYGSTDGGGNTGWIFGVARFRVGSAGNWSSTAIWSTTSSGAGGASVPTLPDGVFFTTFTLTNVTTLDVSPQIYSLDMTTVTRDFNFGTNSITINSTQGTVLNGLGLTPTSSTADNTVIIASTKSNAITVIPSNGTVPFSLNFTGGTYSLTFMDTASRVKNLNFTGFSGTWTTTTGGASSKAISGNLTLSSGMTITASTESVSVGSTTGTIVVTSNGKDIPMPVTFNPSVGATVQLADAMSVSANAFTFSRGGLDLNGKVLTVLNFSSASSTRVLTFNGGTIVCTRGAGATAFNLVNATGFTSVAGTGVGKISMTAATAKTFAGLSAVYNCTLSNDGAGALTITGSNTFTTIANGVQPTSFLFTAGTTTTVTTWSVSGTAGNLVTIGSPTAATHTLSQASGTVSSNYLSISYSVATGGANWYAGANSTDGGNNTGWIFSAVPTSSTGVFFFMF